ncbi:hypothetical protein BKA66DRAFT_514077 [Pyrenochaeta sp. MPI-SDFR-AT-0127]|nr:hypothetical protein BKA66DRAFT_514077 [Pyrenochaeta sp. MPI-SDFR-AT-0127]
MDWENRGSSHTAIYQTSYSQFFDSYTDQCDSTSFYVVDFIGPKITKDLRIKLNRLTHEVNYVISYYADLLNVDYSHAVGNPSLFSAAVSFVDVDISYNGHRFCRQGVQEPEHHNPDTHFFNLNLLASTDGKTVTVSDTNMPIPHENATAAWIDANYGDGVHASWAWVMKTFHPTPAGCNSGKSCDSGDPVLGDYVAFASQDPNSAIYQGIIPHSKAIFRNYRYYNMPHGSGVHVRPTFSGSQKPHNANSEFHECYKIATIDELHDNFVRSPDLYTRNKVILLMAGTIDVLYDVDLDHWPDRYTSLIHDIFDSDPDAQVFAGHIPMIGYNSQDPFKWFGLHKRIAQFNARLSALVDQLATEHGYRIMTVHTSATTREHLDGYLLLPNTRGYLRIALNFVEHITMAALIGWFNPGPRGVPNGVDSISIGSQIPARPGDNDTLIVDKVTCNQEFEFFAGQGMPTKEDTLKSASGLSME